MYLFVRRDLTHPQQVVQACHVAMEAAKAFLNSHPEHPSLVVCGIRDGPRLYRCLDFLESRGIRYRTFHEPDLGDELTAVATEPVYGPQRRLFHKYQLLRDPG